jgi:hypothetical protein
LAIAATANVPRSIAAVTYHFVIAVWERKRGRMRRMEPWQIIAHNLSQAGFIVTLRISDPDCSTIGING